MKKYVVYGAQCINAEAALQFLSKRGEVIAFADSNPLLHGQYFYGYPCLPPSQIPRDAVAVIASSTSAIAIGNTLKQQNIPYTTYAKELYDSVDINAMRDLFCDDLSKKTFDAMVNLRVNLDKTEANNIRVPLMQQYFDYFGYFNPTTYIDCGAYVGDTIEHYLYHFLEAKRIIAFEPVAANYEKLVYRCERLKREWPVKEFSLEQAFVSDKNGTADVDIYENGIGGSSMKEGDGGTIKTYSIDAYMKGEDVGFIKADIECAEMKMLIGAQETIRKYKPRIALAAYHFPDDMYQFPLFLRSLVPEYQFGLRFHGNGNNITELCFYASI